MLAYVYPILGVFWTLTIFFLWAAWIFVVVWVLIDNFRRDDHPGWAKALWTLAIIFLPVVGVVLYMVLKSGPVNIDV